MADLFNLIPLHGIFSARQRQSSLSETHVDQVESGKNSLLLFPITYINHSIDSLREYATATVVPRWLVRDGSENSETDYLQGLRKEARLSRLRDDLTKTTTPRLRRKIEKELYALQFDQDIEAERRAALFDVERVRSRLWTLESARDADDLPRMLSLIRNQVSRDLGGICNPKLYDRPGVRTQPVIDRYQKTVAEILDRIVAACRNDDSRLDKHMVEQQLGQTCKYASGVHSMRIVLSPSM